MSSPEATIITSLCPINREWLMSVCGGRTPLLQRSCKHVVLSGWSWPYSSSHLLLSPALLNNPLPYTISSLPPTQELCSVMVSGFKISLSGNHWKRATSERRVLEVSKPLNAALLFNSSVTLKNITNTKEMDMATPSSILSWQSHAQRSLVGYSPWVTGAGPVWTNLACMQACILSWSSSQISGK